MSTLIKNIAKQYSNLHSAGVSRNTAFGVVYNNTTVGGVRLQDHASGKRVVGQVLTALGYKSEVSDVAGSLDDF
tara:strand:+ start:504 stop:725 length:222 start_codon:yes stop_codon:yes gene_type:complete